jgi:hypothetical protein
MKSMLFASLIGLALVPSSADAAPSQVNLSVGSGALATYEQVSDDGCVVTRGEIVVRASVLAGEVADGIYVTAVQENVCTGEGRGYAGYAADGVFGVNGVRSGRYRGVVIADEYSGQGAAPLTFELDLRWTGRGPATPQNDVYDDGQTVTFTVGATRAATTAGELTIDGAAATVTSASLIHQTSGQITR